MIIEIQKRCCGYHGVCHSPNANSSGYLLRSEFTPSVLDAIKEGKSGMCKSCRRVNSLANVDNATSRQKMVHALAGGQRQWEAAPEGLKRVYRAGAWMVQNGDIEGCSSTAELQEQLGIVSRVTSNLCEGPGFVYVMQNPRCPEYLRIGAESEDGGRVAGNATYGYSIRLYNHPFAKRYAAEKAVHEVLSGCRDGNHEIFKCSALEAQVAIETVALRLRVAA